MGFIQDFINNRKEKQEFIEGVNDKAKKIRRDAYEKEKLKLAAEQGKALAQGKKK